VIKPGITLLCYCFSQRLLEIKDNEKGKRIISHRMINQRAIKEIIIEPIQ
jgi:hypothetical protein